MYSDNKFEIRPQYRERHPRVIRTENYDGGGNHALQANAGACDYDLSRAHKLFTKNDSA